jgi:hypothetical protein
MLHHPFVDWEDLLVVDGQVYGSYIDAFRACSRFTTSAATLRQRSGRLFELDGRVIFVPDEDWTRARKSGRSAFFNKSYNVWCFEE